VGGVGLFTVVRRYDFRLSLLMVDCVLGCLWMMFAVLR